MLHLTGYKSAHKSNWLVSRRAALEGREDIVNAVNDIAPAENPAEAEH